LQPQQNKSRFKKQFRRFCSPVAAHFVYTLVNLLPTTHPGIDVLLQTKGKTPFDKAVTRLSKPLFCLVSALNRMSYFSSLKIKLLSTYKQAIPGNTTATKRQARRKRFMFSKTNLQSAEKALGLKHVIGFCSLLSRSFGALWRHVRMENAGSVGSVIPFLVW
jgi:hypothetical protein